MWSGQIRESSRLSPQSVDCVLPDAVAATLKAQPGRRSRPCTYQAAGQL